MDISLMSIMQTRLWDFRRDMAQSYANALKNAIELHLDNNIVKKQGFFLSKKGYKKGDQTIGANFQDKLYVGNIHRIERQLYYNDEVLADDDQIINVVVVDGPITRDGGACSYGSKDHRDQILYANTFKQVIGHLFIINTPGGDSLARNDYAMAIADCRDKGKPTVAWIDGGCYSLGVNLATRCDRTIVMNPMDEYGCIGTMAAFWATAHDTVDKDGCRYVELVGEQSPEKNAWWREAAKGEYDKLQGDLNKLTEEFQNSVRENRPLVTEEMLSGKVFDAQAVIPQLVDEVGDMDRAIACIFELIDKKLTPARFAVAEDEPNEPKEDPKEPEEDPKEPEEEPKEPEEEPKEPEEYPDNKGDEQDEDGEEKKKRCENPADESSIHEIAMLREQLKNTKEEMLTVEQEMSAIRTSIAQKEADISAKDAMIEQLKKQVSDLKSEVKEMSDKPAPMTDGNAGIPSGNGTGEAPKQYQKRITRNMSYEEIRKASKR